MQTIHSPVGKALLAAAKLPPRQTQAGYARLFKLLKRPGLSFDPGDLMLAATLGDPRLVEMLLEGGAPLHHPEYALEYSPLHYMMFCAPAKPTPGIITVLVRAGADPNAMDKQGDTPLNCLLSLADTDTVMPCLKALLDLGADPNAASRPHRGRDGVVLAGITPLFVASIDRPNPSAVELLLSRGADPRIPVLVETLTASGSPTTSRPLVDSLFEDIYLSRAMDPTIATLLKRTVAHLEAREQQARLQIHTDTPTLDPQQAFRL